MGVELAYTDAVAKATSGLYAKVQGVIPAVEWPVHAPLIDAINRLKREKNAVILAHNYMTPEIFHCVGDFAGDSLALAREAARTRAGRTVERVQQPLVDARVAVEPDGVVDAGHDEVAAQEGRAMRHGRRVEQPVVGHVGQQAAMQRIVVG